MNLDDPQIHNLLGEALETEMGGIQVYRTALECVLNPDLETEWKEYLEQTENHERILRGVFEDLGLDAEAQTPGRRIVRHIGESLVKAMKMAREGGEPEAAEIVAAECVVEAETKDTARALKDAYEQVEGQEDEHLYHTKGWARELRVQSLGMPAVLPPPEEAKDVKTAIGAARARKARGEMKKAS